jgi:hypothetical protein
LHHICYLNHLCKAKLYHKVHDCPILHRINDSIKLLIVLADLELEFLNSLRHAKHLLLQCRFVRLQITELLLESLSLGCLVAIVASYFLDYSVELVGQRFSCVLALHGQNGLESLLLRSEDLDLFLVNIQILCELPDSVILIL